MSTLSVFRRNVYSQNGEDGVIAEIVRRLGISEGCFVEFGAWDGKYLSNTYLLLEAGWRGVYIEGDDRRHAALLKQVEAFGDRTTCVHTYVAEDGENSLDSILGRTDLSVDFDLLSIDIDSNDWQVWRSVRNYYPKIVLIEINSAIPVGIYQTHRGGSIIGSSFSSTVRLGRQKGYVPVCHTGNLIFVRTDLISRIGIPDDELINDELLFDYGWLELQYEKEPYSDTGS